MKTLEPGVVINDRAVVIGNFEPDTPEWHDARSGHLGGSEISAVVGLNPWDSRFSLWYKKRDNLIEDLSSNPLVEWGSRLEKIVFEKFSEGLNADQVPTTGTTFHCTVPGYEFASANPDGLIWKQDPFTEEWYIDEILEIKTSGYGDGYGPQGSDIVPVYYLCQVLWYCWILGIRKATLAVLIGGSDYRTYSIEYSAEDAQLLADQGRDFMNDIKLGIEPNITSDMATYEMVRTIHPLIDPDLTIDIPIHLGEEYLSVERAWQEVQDMRKGVHARVMKEAGKAKIITMSGEPIARRQMPGRGDKPYLRKLNTIPDHQVTVSEALADKAYA